MWVVVLKYASVVIITTSTTTFNIIIPLYIKDPPKSTLFDTSIALEASEDDIYVLGDKFGCTGHPVARHV